MFSRLRQSLLLVLACFVTITGYSQDPALRVLDPRSFSGGGSGWSVIPSNGGLNINVPLASVPGEIPISLRFHYWATTSLSQDPVLANPSVTDHLFETPIRGRVFFDSSLENPDNLLTSDVVSYSPASGKSLVAPAQFGLVGKTWTQVKTHTSGKFIHYLASLADLGTLSSKVSILLPEGFDYVNAQYTVLVGKDSAQIYQYVAGAANGMTLPILWVDRFGHSVSFKWKLGHTTSNAYVFSVLALNQRGLGVQAQWGQQGSPAAATTTPDTLFRADFIGFQAPSVQISGYQGSVFNASTMGIVGTSYWNSSLGTPSFRPTGIVSDNPANLPTPSWITGGLPIPSSTGTNTWAPALNWSFNYTPNLAELVSFSDPLGVITNFSYETKFFYPGPEYVDGLVRYTNRMVSTAKSVDVNTGVQLNRTWTYVVPVYDIYNYPVHWTSYTWKTTLAQSYSTGDTTEIASQEWTFAGPDQPVHFSNGAVKSERIYSSSKTWATQTNTLVAGGIDGTLSLISGLSRAMDGEPTEQTTNVWDSTGNLPTSQILKVGGTTWQSVATSYNTDMGVLNIGQPTSMVTSRLVNSALVAAPTKSFSYNSQGLLSVESTVGGALARGRNIYYDTEGHITKVSKFGSTGIGNTISNETNYVIGSDGLPSSSTTTFASPNGGRSNYPQSWTYSSTGAMVSGTDGRGVTINKVYDSRGRIQSETPDGLPTINYFYPTEWTTNWSSSDGRSGSVVIDGFGRIKSKLRADGITETIFYDLMGRQSGVTETNALGLSRSSSRKYDPIERVVTASTWASPLNQSVTYVADGASAKVTTTLSNGKFKSIWTDPLGRVVKTSTPRSIATTTFNAMNRPLLMTQTAGSLAQTRTYTYNELGDLTSKAEPETGSTTFGSFDPQGNPQTIINAVRSRTLTYDGLGRLRSAIGGADSISHIFDGLLPSSTTSVSKGLAITQTYSYTAASDGALLESEVQTLPGATWTTGFNYDSYGRLNSLRYPSGRIVNYTYDNKSRIQNLIQGGAVLTSVEYDGWGNKKAQNFASGAKDSWAWDNLGAHLTNLTIKPMIDLSTSMPYGYDANGNMSQGSGWNSLVHDSEGRLTSATGFGVANTLTHDGFDNNTYSLTTPTPVSWNNFTFNSLVDNRIPAQQANGALTGWTTNPLNGEPTSIGTLTGANSILNLGWDGLGRLSTVQSNSLGLNQVYAYGPSGLRVQLLDSTTPANNRRYAYTSGGLLLGEYKPGTGGHSGANSVRVFHATSGAGALSRSLGTFAAGDVVNVSLWFQAPAGVSASVALTDGKPYTADDNKTSKVALGSGGWQNLVFTWTTTKGTALWLHLYGDMFTETSGTATASTNVQYDDIQVSSIGRSTVLSEGFEGGLNIGGDPNSLTTWYSCGQTNALASTPDTWLRDVLYLGPQAIAEVDSNGIHELHADDLGTPRVVTNGSTGRIEGTQTFGPYGESLPSPYTNGYIPLIGFTGHIKKDATGLIYMMGRFYSPAWHRFINSDQGMDINAMNQFAYAGGSPIMRNDPTGLQSDWNFFWSSAWEVVSKLGNGVWNAVKTGFLSGGDRSAEFSQSYFYSSYMNYMQMASEFAGRDYDNENQIVEVDGVMEYRIDINIFNKEWGHWWIEMDGTESYGWWPIGNVGFISTLFGVDGVLNGGPFFGGTATTDPHQGDGNDEGVNAFKVYASSKYSSAEYKQKIRDFAKNYASTHSTWSYPFGNNCHSMQNQMNRALRFTLVKIPKP